MPWLYEHLNVFAYTICNINMAVTSKPVRLRSIRSVSAKALLLEPLQTGIAKLIAIEISK